MINDALRTILPLAGWPEERAREVEITGGADPILPTPFRIGETSTLAGRSWGRVRTAVAATRICRQHNKATSAVKPKPGHGTGTDRQSAVPIRRRRTAVGHPHSRREGSSRCLLGRRPRETARAVLRSAPSHRRVPPYRRRHTHDPPRDCPKQTLARGAPLARGIKAVDSGDASPGG